MKPKEEESSFKFEEFKTDKLEESEPKKDLISKLESFEIDINKKN